MEVGFGSTLSLSSPSLSSSSSSSQDSYFRNILTTEHLTSDVNQQRRHLKPDSCALFIYQCR